MVGSKSPLNNLRSSDLPAFPLVAAQIVEQFRSGRPDTDKVLELAMLDPGMYGRVLGLAASSAPLVPPMSLDDAVQVLGLPQVLRTVDRLATESVLLATDDAVVLDLWRHAVTTACTARVLASQLADLPGTWAYSAGLLHDLGRLPMYNLLQRDYLALYEEALVAREPVVEAERRHLGTDHAEVGRALADQLHLPSALVAAIWLHHRPLAESGVHDKARQLAILVALADALAHRLGGDLDFREPDLEHEGELAELLGIPRKQLADIAEEASRETHQAAARITSSPVHYSTRLSPLV